MDYQKIYNQLIERAQNRTLEGYTEKHHIIPKCLGGSNNKENLVELTAREHFLCHRLLCEIYPKVTKLWYALFLMAIGKQIIKSKYKLDSRSYERLKLEFIQNVKGKKKPKGFGKGRVFSPTHIENMSKAKLGIKKPQGTGEKISIARKGKPNLKNAKKVLQYDKNKNFIKEWDSAQDAGNSLNIHYGSISCCCLNKTKSAGGFIWEFKK